MSPVHPALPNFFLIGAAKSGTTTLYSALIEHPQVFFSSLKEPNFFNDEANFSQGLDWYVNTYFAGAEAFPARIEGTTRYLYWGEKVAPRLQAIDQDENIRLIAIFREPVERAYSMYWHKRRRNWEDQDTFEEALAAEESRLAENWDKLYSTGETLFGYFREGCYASRMRPFLECFPRERILLLLFDDLKDNFTGTMNRLFRFLEVNPKVRIKPRVSNAYSSTRSQLLKRMMSLSSPIRQVAKYLVPVPYREGFKRSLRKANRKQTAYPPMRADTRRALKARYREEMLAFEEIIGRDLSQWYED